MAAGVYTGAGASGTRADGGNFPPRVAEVMEVMTEEVWGNRRLRERKRGFKGDWRGYCGDRKQDDEMTR